ncbi:DUF1289 domain-containing protein [Litorivicinus lipolyticus]|uniref:DUF1289 domain-containing protein n=1 Tax=Litorivicinus lipolyticus TaxID=418701 RepID=A0A5Q2QD46_9GAMM|nr:DUF1289 domain-containing protein [Litorivicinus lipolyticus]QGG79770.1 DUF1289 domain-containing protein [Litorivicinus lipolyticus]
MNSPCTQRCDYIAADNQCAGCGRTLIEIAQWGSLSDAERARIIADLRHRAPADDQLPRHPRR